VTPLSVTAPVHWTGEVGGHTARLTRLPVPTAVRHTVTHQDKHALGSLTMTWTREECLGDAAPRLCAYVFVCWLCPCALRVSRLCLVFCDGWCAALRARRAGRTEAAEREGTPNTRRTDRRSEERLLPVERGLLSLQPGRLARLIPPAANPLPNELVHSGPLCTSLARSRLRALPRRLPLPRVTCPQCSQPRAGWSLLCISRFQPAHPSSSVAPARLPLRAPRQCTHADVALHAPSIDHQRLLDDGAPTTLPASPQPSPSRARPSSTTLARYAVRSPCSSLPPSQRCAIQNLHHAIDDCRL
jgi:hypothetical protein